MGQKKPERGRKAPRSGKCQRLNWQASVSGRLRKGRSEAESEFSELKLLGRDESQIGQVEGRDGDPGVRFGVNAAELPA